MLLILCRNHGSHFEKAKTAFKEGAGRDELAEPPADVLMERRLHDSMEKENVNEKVEQV
jgi:MFS transporter, SHS family, lactate transporter